MGLTTKQKLVLRELVEFTCEECCEHEKDCGFLEAHRIIRGNAGGLYIPRNIKMLCNSCHKKYHHGEFK